MDRTSAVEAAWPFGRPWALRSSVPLLRALWRSLPEGRALPEAAWQRRHRGIVILLWLHVLGVIVFGLLTGHGFAHSLTDGMAVAFFAVAVVLPRRGRKFRASMATVGLLTASAVL